MTGFLYDSGELIFDAGQQTCVEDVFCYLNSVKTKPECRFATLALFSLLVSGCASYPQGFSKSQWDRMPPDEQAEYRRRDARQALREGRETERQVADAIKKAESAHEVFPLDRSHLSAK
jgi:hypothetical protein